MATELAHAYVTIIPSLKGASKTIANELGGVNVRSTSKGWGKTLAGGIGGGLVAAGAIGVKAIGAIGAAVGGLAIGGGISRALKIDQATMKFENMGVDVESAMKSCNEAVTGTAYGLDAAATVASSLAASGIEAGDGMTKSLKGVAGMAAMSGRSMEDIGLIFGKVAAQGKLQGDELTQFAESGVNATAALAKHLGKTQAEVREMVKNGEIDFQTFSDAMYATFGDAAQGANETFQGAMSNVMAALSRIGAKFASPALEGLRKVFVALIPAIDAVSKLLDPAVETFTKFVDTVSGRAVSGIEAFTEALTNTGSFMSAFKAMFGELFDGTAIGSFISKINGFFGAVRAGVSPVTLLKAQWQDFVNYIGSGATSAIEMLKAKIATLPQPIQNVISAVSGFGRKIMDAFSGFNVGGAAVAATFAGILLKFGAPLTAVVTKVVAFGAKVAAVFSKLGGFGGIIATVAMKFNTFRSAIVLCGGGIKGLAVVLGSGLRTALAAVLTPVNLIVIGIAALAAAFAYLMTTNEGFRNTIMGLVATIGASLYPIITTIGQALKNLASTVLPLITNLIAAIVPVLGQVIVVIMQVVAAIAPIITTLVGVLVPIVTSVVEIVITAVTAIIGAVLPVISTILTAIQSAMPIIQTIIMTVMGAVRAIVQAVWPVVQGIIKTAVNIVLAVVQAAMPAIQGIIQTVMSVILGIITKVWPTVQRIIQTAVQVIQTVIKVAWPVMQRIIQTVMNIVLALIQRVWPAMQAIIQTVMSAISAVINAVWPAIQGIIEAAMTVIQGVISAVMAIIQGDWEGAWNIIKDALSSAWESIKSGVSSGIENVMSLISELPGKIKDFFADAGSWLLDAGKSIIQGLADGISGAVGTATDAISGVLSSVRSFLPFSPAKKGPFSGKGWTLYSGQSMVEGLAAGIVKSSGTAQAAMNSVMSGISGVASIQGFGSDIAPFDDVSANVRTWSRSEFVSDAERSNEQAAKIQSALSALGDRIENLKIVMDSGELVGATAAKYDKAQGRRQLLAERGF